MDKLTVFKKVSTFVVGVGVGRIVHSIIENNATAADSLPAKGAMVVGSYVLGVMIADEARAFTERKIDALVDAWYEHVAGKI